MVLLILSLSTLLLRNSELPIKSCNFACVMIKSKINGKENEESHNCGRSNK